MQPRSQLVVPRGIGKYQEVVLDGQTIFKGSRDCVERWEVIAPHVTDARTALDVGSNFGWFGARLCDANHECVVASVEADHRSALVQRQMLAANRLTRVSLLTDLAGVELIGRFAKAGQGFDAALCLSVLHWIDDHRRFMQILGSLARTIFVELPDPRETGAGRKRVRAEIGDVEAYLASLFPDRERMLLARFPSHRDARYARGLWLVKSGMHESPHDASVHRTLDASTIVGMGLSWPPRHWWTTQIERLGAQDLNAPAGARVSFGPRGLEMTPKSDARAGSHLSKRSVWHVPEQRLLTNWQWAVRFVRRARGKLRRGMARAL